MNSPAPPYRKLPGRGLGWAGFARLWIAEDHLLEVNSLLFTERYRRFFFKDISALVIRRIKRSCEFLFHGRQCRVARRHAIAVQRLDAAAIV